MRIPFLAFALLLVAAPSARANSSDFDKAVGPYLAQHCHRCHGEKKQKGELRLDTLSRDFAAGASAMRWADVMDRISSGDMPPEKEPQPSQEEVNKVVDWLALKLKE